MVYNERLAWKPYRLQPSKKFWVGCEESHEQIRGFPFPRINSWVEVHVPSHICSTNKFVG